MNDKLVFLYKSDFTKEDWKKLSWEFGFNDEDSSVNIHIIKDNDFDEEEMTRCSHCGCEEYADEMKDGMCDDCYEDWLDDIKEQEEDDE
jgi:hypothetical protein